MTIPDFYRLFSRFQESKLVLSDLIRTGNSVSITLLAMYFLGGKDIGLYFFGSAVVIIFSLLTRLGGENLIVRGVAGNSRSAIGFNHYALLSLSVYILFLVPVYFYIRPVLGSLVLSTIFLSIPFFQPLRYFEFFFRAKREFGVLLKARFMSSLSLYSIMLYFFLRGSGFDVIEFAFLLLLEQVFFLIVTSVYYITYEGSKPNHKIISSSRYIKDAKTMVFGSLASILALKLPVLYLGRFGTDLELSIVSTQLRILDLLLLVPTLLFNSYLPKMLQSYGDDEKYTKVIIGLTRFCIVLVFFISIFGYTLSLLLEAKALSLISLLSWILIFVSGVFSILGNMTAKHLVVIEDYRYIAVRNYMFLVLVFFFCLTGHLMSVKLNFLIIILSVMFFVNVVYDYFFKDKRELARLKRRVIYE